MACGNVTGASYEKTADIAGKAEKNIKSGGIGYGKT